MKLQQMIDSGKTYIYRDQHIKLERYDVTHNEIEIFAIVNGIPQQFIKENEIKLAVFLDNFKEVETVEEEETEVEEIQTLPKKKIVYEPVIYQETKNQFKNLTQMLMDDINKVREKPEYVNQARQVCNNVSAIINITKLQLQLLKNDH